MIHSVLTEDSLGRPGSIVGHGVSSFLDLKGRVHVN